MKSFWSVVLISLLAVNVSCSSKKPQSSASEASIKDGVTMELNGNSDDGKAGDLRTIYFEYNSSDISSRMKSILKENAQFLKLNPKVTVQVEGHCDERGGRQFNLALGERRARGIKDLLVAQGIKSSRIKVFSYGNERPVTEGQGEEYWSKNRRGSFTITSM